MVKTNHLKIIAFAEKEYKDLLESFFARNYPENNLVSHGLDHHRRVWGYAKELIACCSGEIYGADFLQKLILTCYLHDIGMSVDPGVRHGLQSRILCEKFMEQNNLIPSEFKDVLDAIENHDDKEYKKFSENSLLLKLLSVADDLDAFGYTGIYRYSEIYILRRIDLRLLGEEVRRNLKFRFENFNRIFGNYPEIIHKHESRFIETDNFFRNFSEQIEYFDFKSDEPSGYCGVIKIITEIVNKKTSFGDILIQRDMYRNDLIISTFITRMPEIFMSQTSVSKF